MQVEIRAYGSNATEFVVSTSSERSIQILRYFCELRNFMIVMSVGFAAAIWCSTFNMALKWIWSVLVMVCFVYVASFGFFRLMDWNVQKESILLIPAIGIQLTKHYWNGKKQIRFIDRTHLQAILINEAISFASVYYYIAFVTKTSPDRLILAFEHLRPRVSFLQEIYNSIRTVCFPTLSKMSLPYDS
ncbi:unnamed protein product [Albugo candida]|uniref:Phosphatidylinositol N-acetylglucosaminyltransferase subunit H conserved domain-containing protein n=1 Tax=Albugo candida TaxID=65357 RepID=A0A024G234_9STRA|nr:unnamed protein product [Albugo candida]|eukprot:CCI40626.1 unnamed protein product [Albugo candida]